MAVRRRWAVRTLVLGGLALLLLLGRGLGLLSGGDGGGDASRDRDPQQSSLQQSELQQSELQHPGPEQPGPQQTGPEQTGPEQTGPEQLDPQQAGSPALARSAARTAPGAGDAAAGDAGAGDAAAGEEALAGGRAYAGAANGAAGTTTGVGRADSAPVARSSSGGAAEEPAPGGDEPARDEPAGEEPAGDGPARDEPVGAARSAGVDDPRLARLAVVRTALAEDRLGAASAALDRLGPDLAGLPGGAELAQHTAARIAAACAALAAALEAGEVLRARRQLQALLEPDSAATVAALQRLTASRGWPGLAGAAAANPAAVAVEPPAQALPRDRAVTARLDGERVRTRVVAQRGDRVTLRVVGAAGVTFPTVAVWTVEPEAVTGAEAADLGLLALAAGAVDYARLWCVCSMVRGGAAGERLEQLRRALH